MTKVGKQVGCIRSVGKPGPEQRARAYHESREEARQCRLYHGSDQLPDTPDRNPRDARTRSRRQRPGMVSPREPMADKLRTGRTANVSNVGARLKCHRLCKVEMTPHWCRVGRRAGAEPLRSAAPDRRPMLQSAGKRTRCLPSEFQLARLVGRLGRSRADGLSRVGGNTS